MRNLPLLFEQELISQEFIQALLISMTIVESEIRITDWGTPILHDSELYYPRAFQVQPVYYGGTKIVDDVTVSIDDTDRSLFASFGEHDSGKYPFKLTWVVLDRAGREIASLVVFSGDIDRWSYEPGKITVVAASIFNQWTRETTSKYYGSCRWRIFKGVECKYAGIAITCDRTYDLCDSYGNTDNYGGFRWLPSMINKKLETK